MKIIVVMDPNKTQYGETLDPKIQGQFGMPLPEAPADKRRIYVLDVDAAFEIEQVVP